MKPLEPVEMRWHRQRLKEARRAGFSDLEDAHQLVVAIESLGKALSGNPHAVSGKVECCLLAFAALWDPNGEAEDPHASPLATILERVRKQRNDYAHEGTAARRLARQAAEAAIRLERALLKAEKEGKSMEMRDVMITPVICAEDWQTLAHVRRVMLLHEFTVLPYRSNGKSANAKWKFIEAEHVVKALFEGGNGACGEESIVDVEVRKDGQRVRASRQIQSRHDLGGNGQRRCGRTRHAVRPPVGLDDGPPGS